MSEVREKTGFYDCLSLCILFSRGDYWIRKKYFCDGRVNCPKDPDPLDEADVSCATTPAPPPPSTTTRASMKGVFECVGGKCLDDGEDIQW